MDQSGKGLVPRVTNGLGSRPETICDIVLFDIGRCGDRPLIDLVVRKSSILFPSSPSVVQIGAIGFWLLAIFFVGTLLLDTLHPFTVYQKRLLSTKLQGRMDELLMQKAAEIEAYDVYEKSTFYTSVRSFRNNEYFVTLWLDMILDAMGGVILIVTSFVFLWEIALWFPLALLIVSFPKLYMEVQLSNATFEGRDELIEMRRRAEYFLSLPLTPELAQEVKLFRLVPFFQEKYQNVMRNLLAALYRDQRKWVFHSFLSGDSSGSCDYYCYFPCDQPSTARFNIDRTSSALLGDGVSIRRRSESIF